MPKKFRMFVLANAQDQNLAREAMALIDLIPKSWESHRRQLPVPQSQLGDELYHALLSATGEGIKRIEFLPFGLEPAEPPNFIEDERLNELYEDMAYLLPECVSGYLDFEEPYVNDRLDGKLEMQLEAQLNRLFGGHLDVVADLLYFYLSFVLLGERERALMVTPVVKLLPRVIPIGEYDGEPGAWLALVG